MKVINSQNILVSVSIVTRNRSNLLDKAIRSAYNQTYNNIEIVLVDNASIDNTVEMVRKKWPDVKIIQMHKNIGCQPGRNIAMANCRGKYIFNLDDDGLLAPYTINAIVNRFELDSDIAVIDCYTPPIEQSKYYRPSFNKSEKWVSNFKGGASALKKSILVKSGYFPEFARGGSEAVLAARILDVDYYILYLPSAVMFHPEIRKGKVLKRHSFYLGWHHLKRSFLYMPAPRCFTTALWRSFRGLWESIKNGTSLPYVSGIFRFFLDLPNTIEERKPIKKDTVKKISFLTYNVIEKKDTINNYKQQATKNLILKRWQKWRKINSNS